MPKMTTRGTRLFAHVCLGALAALLLTAVPLEAVSLRGQIMRVGYEGSSSDPFVSIGDVYRVGRWTPVVVELNNDDGDQFEGAVEVRQVDADGDEVVGRKEIAVKGMRQFTLYVPAGPFHEDRINTGFGYKGPPPFSVRVFDSEGRLAPLANDQGEPVKELLPPRELIAASPDALVVLDMSERPVHHLNRLKDQRRYQECFITRCSPRDLPDSAAGLEPIDVVVWDAPEPGVLDMLQNQALVEWVQRGGRLIVGVGKTWNSLSAHQLFAPLLPARLEGTESTSDVTFVEALLPRDETQEEQRQIAPLIYCPLTLDRLAPGSVCVLPAAPRPDQQVWMTRRACGGGQILLMAAELKDVLALNNRDENMSLLRTTVLNLRPVRDNEQQNTYFGANVDAFSRVAAQTAFQTTSGFFFVFAFAFVIGYIILLTAGSWTWLRRHGAVRHAWVASAALAVGVSGLSLGAVQLVRALGQGVHEMTIVDGQAGSFDATATSYLGLRTASHTLVDLCVPAHWAKPSEALEARAALRPYTTDVRGAQQITFSVPQRYEGVAQLGELKSVPLRATLKQFEATWRGSLDGRLVASLRTMGQSPELAPSSWVENQLGTDLYDCYLFTKSAQSELIHVYYLPALADGQRMDWGRVRQAMEARFEETRPRYSSVRDRVDELTGEQTSTRWSPPILRAMLDQCLNDLNVRTARDTDEARRDQPLIRAGSAPYVPALLLMTFFDDPVLSGLLQARQELHRSQGHDLDVSWRLERGTALFVGFSETAGPLRLCRRNPDAAVDQWKSIKPSRSAVMYRFMAPVN